MTFLFIATIGPVQPFIASARRTRDLYVGSTLLSELSKAAANALFQEVKKEQGVSQLIFPAISLPDEHLLNPESPLNVANKIVAIIQNPPHGTGEKIREAIKARLEIVKMAAIGTITLSDREKADAQIANLVEYFWVAVPLGSMSDYKNARKHAEALLSARKNTQFFNAVSWGDLVPKSSIDGQRESVIPEGYYPDRRYDDKARVKAKTEQLYRDYNAGPHERLSAVDLLKRRGLKSMHEIVHSTSHIAAAPFLESLKNLGANERPEAKRLWDDYIDKVGTLAPTSIVEYVAEKLKNPHPVTGNVDGALLFKERLLHEAEYPDELKYVDEALAKFFRFTDSYLDGLRPSPYYAILLADGDGMGKAIEAHAKGEHGAEHHRNLSKALSQFSEQVEAIVQGHYGSLFYAGGDDVMALLPLNVVLECAYELSQKFQKALTQFSYQEKDKDGKETTKQPTLSAGIAVVHHVSLLDEALALARSAEHRAKDQPGKNALAITIRKRGGEDYPLAVGWESNSPKQSFLSYAHLREIITLYERGFIPKGAAYELRDMVQRLQPARGDLQSEQLQKIIQIDAARILRRKLLLPERSDERKEVEKKFAGLLNMIGVKKDENRAFTVKAEVKVDMAQFINALIVAQIFAEETGERKGRDQLDG